MSLREQLSGARWVQYDADTDLTFAWFGGHGVHVYRDSGDEMDFFNVRSAQNHVSLDEVIAAVHDKIAQYHDMG